MASREPTLTALVPALSDRLPELLADVQVVLRSEWPEYAQFLAENTLEVTIAADGALHRLVSLAEEGEADADGDRAMFEEIGRIQFRQGRDLSALLAAYRAGARVFWHHVSEVAVDVAVEPRVLAALAEAVFLFVDRLSSASARGYVLEQSETVATRERLREELVDLLLSDRADRSAVAAAADRAGWRMPASVAVVLLGPDSAAGHRLLARLDGEHLVFSRPPLLGAILSDPARPGLRPRMTAALHGTQAVVGVTVPPEYLPASLDIARIAARLQRDGVLRDDPVFTEEHLDAIIVHRDARLLDALRRRALAPLAAESPASQERLVETLVAWLRHLGDRQAVAAQLHVHPQTVRYRLARLHELFGEALGDPQTRVRLVLALGWGPPPVGQAENRGGAGRQLPDGQPASR